MTYVVSNTAIYAITLLAIWELVWKGLALWKAARLHETGWFLAILIINSAGILPIIYLIIRKGRPELEKETKGVSYEKNVFVQG